MMSIFNKYLLSRDNLLKRRILIDSSLYRQLDELSEIYDASVNRLVNLAIIDFLEDGTLGAYKTAPNEISEGHNFTIRESSYQKLLTLKEKTGIPVCKLINMSIYHTLHVKS